MDQINIIDNPLEEVRFGIKSAKIVNLNAENLHSLPEALRNSRHSFYSVRISTDQVDLVQAVEGMGFRLMDTLVYYRKTSLKLTPSFDSKYTYSIANAESADLIYAMAKKIFKNYVGHYHADPNFAKSSCDEVYADWAYQACKQHDVADAVIVAKDKDTPVGFAAIKCHNTSADGVLFGVDPDYKNQGIYRSLVHQFINWAVQNKMTEVIYSSQINNYAVHKIWAGEGAYIYKSLYTLHYWKQ